MIGWIVVAVLGSTALAIVVIVAAREQRRAVAEMGQALLSAQRHLSASSAAVKIAEDRAARCVAMLHELHKQVGQLVELDRTAGSGIVSEALLKLKGDVEAACFAAGSIPPKERT